MATVIRVFVIYLLIIAGLRVLGKREFGELSPLEMVTLLLIPEIVSQAIIGDDFSVTNAAIGLMTLFSLVFITSLLSQYFPPFEKLISSAPTILVEHGQFIETHMNKERITPEEIFNVMHKAGFEELSQVRWAILETDGKIAIIPENSSQHSEQPLLDESHSIG